MAFPTDEDIQSIFGELTKRPAGYVSFFTHVADNVRWEITGQNTLSGVWTSKSQFLDNVWMPIIKLIADPGPKLELLIPTQSTIMRNEDSNWVVVELKTADTRTKLGNRLYNQHYCWHCKFDSTYNNKIVQVKAFIDSSTAESVLAEEKLRQEALSIMPTTHVGMSMESPEYPEVPFDSAFKYFLELFYLLADAPSEHERYVQCFTPDATLVLGAKTVQGREGIFAVRSSMSETVKKRTHHPKQVFPHGPNSKSAMVFGTVDYEFKDGSFKTVDWAAKCNFVKLEQHRVYLDYYQVYLADYTAWE